jgi:hypothetical protein
MSNLLNCQQRIRKLQTEIDVTINVTIMNSKMFYECHYVVHGPAGKSDALKLILWQKPSGSLVGLCSYC